MLGTKKQDVNEMTSAQIRMLRWMCGKTRKIKFEMKIFVKL